ncbi:MAG TPA: peptidylprolyl isomerase [Vicinamibacterales bacterium]|nr:peptidylprolyl isomerase [Vicinamibacterales bacterium]
MIAFVFSALLGVLQAAAPTTKQAVVDTTAGTFVIDLDAADAPLTTAYFMKTASAGGFNGTIFHKVIKYGIVQGGDPLTRDPARRAQWGTGGLNAVKDEPRAAKMRRGSVAVVTVPGKPDSAGQQFFIAVVDQPGLDGKYTVFGHVSDGIEIVQKISETPIDDKGLATERVEIKSVVIRDTPPVLFVNDSVQELGAYRAVLDTSAGPIVVEFLPEKARETVRQFLRLADAGVYNGVAFHRVAPGFVIQTGAMNTRAAPLTEKQQTLIHNLAPEFNDTKHVKGIVSMARGDAPDSATTSFFIVTGAAPPALDGNYTAFGRVVDGMNVVDAIEQTPRTGETPNARIELKSIKIERK